MFKNRKYVGELEKHVGKDVLVAGWVHDTRVLGGINFILLRDSTGIGQITAPKKKVDAKILEIIEKLRQEDVVAVEGKVVKSDVAKSGVEVIPQKIEIVAKSETPLPLDPRGVTKTNLDTQLDWRVLHMRTDEARAIFRIQSQILRSFREFLTGRGYVEIQPPVIIASASEGGAELFSVPYFEKQAYLAQSPQLYKQMCAIAFGKVFAVVPIFRAEKFDQPTHLNEIRQMDIEQAFATDEDVMKVLEECLVHIIKSVKKNCTKELKVLKRELTVPKLPFNRLTYTEAVDMLKKNGEDIEWGEDFSKTQELLLRKLVGKEAFFVKDWPDVLKAFYAMPNNENPKIVRAFDLVYNGLEIASGTQRVHLPELLIKRLKSKELNPDDFKFYIDCFRYGSPVHAGWSIGLERLTMTITGRKNIREVTMFPRDRNRIAP